MAAPLDVSGIKILKVTVIRTGNARAPWRYTAHMAAGGATVIRNATRRYENAYLWQSRVATGKGGLAAHFSFGKAPSGIGAPLARFRVELEMELCSTLDQTTKTEA